LHYLMPGAFLPGQNAAIRTWSDHPAARELATSSVAARHSYGGILPGSCHALTAPHDASLAALLTETRGTPPGMVALAALVEQGPELSLTPLQLFQTSAAVGAALGAI